MTEVGPSFARCPAISDSTSTVIGQLLPSPRPARSWASPAARWSCSDVDSAVTVPIGEEVFTAGIELSGGIRSPYPKGLLIGQVLDVARDPNEVVQTVYLQPAAPSTGSSSCSSSPTTRAA